MRSLKIILATCLLYGLSIFALACCKPKCTDPSNPECSNYDPCYKKIPNAGFKMRESLWDENSETFNEELAAYYGFHDTIIYPKLDLFADFEPIEGIKYAWKFDGMSTIIKTKDIAGFSIYNYTQNSNNYLPLWDSFYTKPIGVTLTVTVPASACVGNDTVYTSKRYITCARRNMYYGRFKGYFSTNPTQEVEIFMNDSLIKNTIDRYYLYYNFPYHANDTVMQDDLCLIGSTPIPYMGRVYNRKLWGIDTSKPYDLERLKGILYMDFVGYYNPNTLRNEVEFTYLYQQSLNHPIETITFSGYQLEAYRRPFGL